MSRQQRKSAPAHEVGVPTIRIVRDPNPRLITEVVFANGRVSTDWNDHLKRHDLGQLTQMTRPDGHPARVLYITGEESTAQVRMRADRITAVSETLYLTAETDLGHALGQVPARVRSAHPLVLADQLGRDRVVLVGYGWHDPAAGAAQGHCTLQPP